METEISLPYSKKPALAPELREASLQTAMLII